MSLVVLLFLACREAPVATSAPDIILITIDTLRADAVGGEATPFLNRLASESVVFTNAHAHNVITLPSHANILTGLYPYQHGIRDNAGYTLAAKDQTIAALLKAKGYKTGAFVGAFPLDKRYGLTNGFDVYDDKYPEGSGRVDFKIAERPAEQVLKAASAWWSAQTSPRFMWVHVYDPHAPYAPPEPFASQYAGKLYQGEVAYTDAMLGKYIEPLLGPETIVVATADHGESLGDHGELTHGLFAYEATLKVPLIVRDRSVGHRVDNRSARHIDIVPTLIERVGLAKPPDRLGASLFATSATNAPSYFESLSASLNRGWAPLVGVIDGGHKLIDLPLPELYDLAADPAEATNLFSERRRVTSQLRGVLASAAPVQQVAQRDVSSEQKQQLLSLGYLTGAAAKKTYTAADDPKNLIAVDNDMHRMIDLYQRGEHDKAIGVAREIVKSQPQMSLVREMLAFMLQQAEHHEAGIATLQELVALGTATDAVKVRLGLLLSEAGRAEEAVRVLAPFAERNDVEILNAYGIALADVGRPAEAVAQFQRVLTIDSTNATAHQNLGIVALRTNRADVAERHLNEALALDPNMPLALNTLGVVYARTGRASQAIEVWRKAVSIDRHLYDALFNLAVVSGQNGRWDVAQEALKQFIQTAPKTRYARELASARQMLAEADRRL